MTTATATDLPALWREWQAQEAAIVAWCARHPGRNAEEAPAYADQEPAEEALRAARPTDLAALAAQLEWLAGAIEEGEILRHAAEVIARHSH